MKLRVVAPHGYRMGSNADVDLELRDVQRYLDQGSVPFAAGEIGFSPLTGTYVHADRKLHLVGVIANLLEVPIVEVRGVISLSLPDARAQVARATIDFDEDYLGVLEAGDALLFHLGVPVRGLDADRRFQAGDFAGSFTDVRVTPAGSADKQGDSQEAAGA